MSAARHPVLDWLVANGKVTEEELANSQITICCNTGSEDSDPEELEAGA